MLLKLDSKEPWVPKAIPWNKFQVTHCKKIWTGLIYNQTSGPHHKRISGPQKRMKNGFIMSVGHVCVRHSGTEEFALLENHAFRKITHSCIHPFIHPFIHWTKIY